MSRFWGKLESIWEEPMELEQWIHLFGAVSGTAAVRERSKWMLFSSGLVMCTILLLTVIWTLASDFGEVTSMGIAVLGILLALIWGVIQQKLHLECVHWNRILRSIESQFAGTEFHRSIHRLFLGEQVCIPASAWVCGEWNPEATRFPVLVRHFSSVILRWTPILFALSFIGLLIRAILW